MGCLLVANIIVLGFLGVIGFEYLQHNGLGDTFYSIRNDFQLVKTTMTTVCM